MLNSSSSTIASVPKKNPFEEVQKQASPTGNDATIDRNTNLRAPLVPPPTQSLMKPPAAVPKKPQMAVVTPKMLDPVAASIFRGG